MNTFDKLFSSSSRSIARELLGKFLVRRVNSRTKAYMIVETEAYVGPHDKASHSYGGRRTKRNEVMWGPPGHWYVYFTYGMHHMLNLVVGKDGYPAAVLIRGIVPVGNLPTPDSQIPYANVLKNISIRKSAKKTPNLIGPGRVTRALKIDKRLNGKPASKASGLWIEDRGKKILPYMVIRTPRIGIGYAEEWKDKPLRFVLKSAIIPRRSYTHKSV